MWKTQPQWGGYGKHPKTDWPIHYIIESTRKILKMKAGSQFSHAAREIDPEVPERIKMFGLPKLVGINNTTKSGRVWWIDKRKNLWVVYKTPGGSREVVYSDTSMIRTNLPRDILNKMILIYFSDVYKKLP